MDTIVAIATAPGIGGIGIVRMSGKDCFSILENIFVPKHKENIEQIKGYTMKYGQIISKETGTVIDEVLVSYFKEPKSYTTENMCEINSHGGMIVLQKILEECLKNGAVLAEPGEFTKRAFLNGRIDLSQAESVIDIIHAKSEKELHANMRQLEGYLSKEIRQIRKELMDIMVDIEASIDYPEYDVEEVTNAKAMQTLEHCKEKLQLLEKSFENGKVVKEGIKTVIVGRPNVGKSSLLNAILKEDRAIVTDIEGTTRDSIEETVTVKGIPLHIIDTAGIRKAKDQVEKIGIEKSKKLAKEADLLIAIFDSTKELTEEDLEILHLTQDKTAIILLNKSDLENNVLKQNPAIIHSGKTVIEIAALQRQGIEELYNEIERLFHLNEIAPQEETMITNIRHKTLIQKAEENIQKAIETIIMQMPIDIIAIAIKNALENLGEIIGENVSENIIKEIFSKFCLGK